MFIPKNKEKINRQASRTSVVLPEINHNSSLSTIKLLGPEMKQKIIDQENEERNKRDKPKESQDKFKIQN